MNHRSNKGDDTAKALAISKLIEAYQRPGCTYKGPSCTCRAIAQSELKYCARCGAASYGTKLCQKKGWKSHKPLCNVLQLYKSHITNLKSPMQKASLARLSLEVPQIGEEYSRRYRFSPVVPFLSVTRQMVLERSKNNLRDLFGSDMHDQQQLLWRWQEISPELFNFLNGTPTPGTVFQKKAYRPYRPGAPQQFRNTPLALGGLLKNGITVIDIGFVDFGVVFDCVDSLDTQGAPIDIVGIEADPFCVAKALVMFEMTKCPSNMARAVVEVWFSSLWSIKTYQAFVAATKSILLETPNLDIRVKTIISYWNEYPRMSRSQSEVFQLAKAFGRQDIRYCTRACNLASERNRVDYFRYHFTKAFYEDESTLVGSPVMSTVNESIGVMQICEDVFEAVPFSVYASYKEEEDDEEGIPLLIHIRQHFESQMKRFMMLVQNGVIRFSPSVGEISIKNTSLLKKIAGLNPYLVSWSNVVDYIPPQEFHTMAKMISGEDTMHFFHSINWPVRTFGVDVYDIHEDSRLEIFSLGLALTEQTRTMMPCFKSQGPFHFRNICSPVLARQHINSFLRYFFSGQDVNCGGFFSEESPLGVPNPFSRTDTTAFLAFAYKESGITFPQNGYDYTL